jgi:hypothetical protein
MEADWSVEVGSDLPVVTVPWEGFVDLRRVPEAVRRIAEAGNHTALAEALIRLNAPESPVFTSKCDYWEINADEIDPFEFEAASEEALQGIGCYVDLLARDPQFYASFSMHEDWVRRAALALRQHRQACARIEFVVRPAIQKEMETDSLLEGFAITLYVSSCGADEDTAKRMFQAALEAATTVTIKTAPIAGE